MPSDPENPTSTSNNKAETASPTQPETDEDKTKKIIAGSLRFLASIFLVCASVYFHPDVDTDIDTARDLYDRIGAFFMTGFALLGMALAFELPSKREKGPLIIGTSTLAIAVLFIGSILTLYDVLNDINDLDAFSGCFIAGTIVLGATQILDLIVYLRQDDRSQMLLLLSMVLAIVGTVFLFLGSVFSVEDVLNDVGSNRFSNPNDIVRAFNRLYDNWERRAALFITGSVLYMVHAITYLIDALM
jgi:nitrogen fixation protein FixH